MTDTITLPRAVGDEVRDLLCHADFTHFHFAAKRREMLLRAASALAALDAALAEPPAKREPVAWLQVGVGVNDGDFIARTSKPKRWNSEWWRFEPLYTHPPAAPPEPEAKREPATVEQVIAAHGPPWGPSATADFFTGWRAAERHHGIKTEDGE